MPTKLSIAAYNEEVRMYAAENIKEHVENYVQKVLDEGSVDDNRKLVEYLSRMAGTEPEKKVDPMSNLATFQFNFINGGVQASLVSPPPLLESIEMEASFPAYVPVVTDDILQDLDDLLGAVHA